MAMHAPAGGGGGGWQTSHPLHGEKDNWHFSDHGFVLAAHQGMQFGGAVAALLELPRKFATSDADVETARTERAMTTAKGLAVRATIVTVSMTSVAKIRDINWHR